MIFVIMLKSMWFHFSKKLLASYRLNFDTLLNKFFLNKPWKSRRCLAPVILKSSICFRNIYIVCIRLSHQIESRYTPFLLFLFTLHNERLTCMAFCTLIKRVYIETTKWENFFHLFCPHFEEPHLHDIMKEMKI